VAKGFNDVRGLSSWMQKRGVFRPSSYSHALWSESQSSLSEKMYEYDKTPLPLAQKRRRKGKKEEGKRQEDKGRGCLIQI